MSRKTFSVYFIPVDIISTVKSGLPFILLTLLRVFTKYLPQRTRCNELRTIISSYQAHAVHPWVAYYVRRISLLKIYLCLSGIRIFVTNTSNT